MFNRDEGLLLVAGVGAELRPLFIFTHPTGSNYTCNPPVTNTDVDIYVFTTLGKDDIEPRILADGWVSCAHESEGAYENVAGFGETWMAYRDGDYNLIVVFKDVRHFARCVAATEMCKALNLMSKDERIRAHALVHLDKDSEFKLPGNYVLRNFLIQARSTDMWQTAPAARPTVLPPSLIGSSPIQAW